MELVAIDHPVGLLEVSQKTGPLAEGIENRLAEQSRAVYEILQGVAKQTGARFPPLPPKLIRPGRLQPIVEALQRLAAGYARENLRR